MLVVIASYIMGTSEYQTHLEEDIKKEESKYIPTAFTTSPKVI
jgi:hypothetical protein